MNVETFLQHELTRRKFLEQTAAGVVAGLGTGSGPVGQAPPPPQPQPSSSASPADRIRVGVIGVRRRGLELALALARFPDAEIASLCDVDGYVRRVALRELSAVQPRVPRVVSDARRVIDDDQLDAVVIATPDHWHVPLAVAACAAGRDVYLETPVTHTLEEADALERAAAGRIVQCGLQQRSGAHFQSAVALMQGGGIGRIGHVRAWAVHRRGAFTPPSDPEDRALPRAEQVSRPRRGEFDYAAWLGGASQTAFDPWRYHHHWRWFWDFGSGELGNLGVHLLDVARWGLGVDLPERVTAQGHRLQPDFPCETPDTLSVQYEYPDVTVTWEHRLWSDFGLEGRSAGVAFHGTEGTLIIDRGGWKVYGRKEGPWAPASPLLEPHLRNFLDCLRTRATPAADVRTGCLSSALCHLGNLAYRRGRPWTAEDSSRPA